MEKGWLVRKKFPELLNDVLLPVNRHIDQEKVISGSRPIQLVILEEIRSYIMMDFSMECF